MLSILIQSMLRVWWLESRGQRGRLDQQGQRGQQDQPAHLVLLAPLEQPGHKVQQDQRDLLAQQEP